MYYATKHIVRYYMYEFEIHLIIALSIILLKMSAFGAILRVQSTWEYKLLSTTIMAWISEIINNRNKTLLHSTINDTEKFNFT